MYLLNVVRILCCVGFCEEVVVVGLLYDVVEDMEMIDVDICVVFGVEVVDLVVFYIENKILFWEE